MFNEPKPNKIDNWVCIKEAGKEYEMEIAKNYLADHDIPASILSKRDSSFSINFGETALVYLYVPKEYEEEARQLLDEGEIDEDQENEEE